MKCKNCPAKIACLDSGIWIDASGFCYCKKQLDGEAPMLHEPMPVIPEAESQNKSEELGTPGVPVAVSQSMLRTIMSETREARTIRRPGAGVTINREQLVRLRQSRLLSRAQLAEAMTTAGYKITPDAIAKIENGYRRPKTATLRHLCEALGCTAEDLLPADPEPGRNGAAAASRQCEYCHARYGHEPGCPDAT